MRNLMLVVFALVLVAAVANVGMAQNSSSGGEQATAIVLGAGILNTPAAPLDFGTVVQGFTYVWDPSNSLGQEEVLDGDAAGAVVASPPAGFSAGGGLAEWDLSTTNGNNLDAVTITFTLPSYLKGTGASGFGVGGKLPISFNSTSAYTSTGTGGGAGPFTTGQAFDPNHPYTTSLDGANGQAVYLGGALTVPGNAVDDQYVATIICTAAITGF